MESSAGDKAGETHCCAILLTSWTGLPKALPLGIDPITRMAVVKPGAFNAEVKAASAEHVLWNPPDPSSFEFCSIGGNIATNAGGLSCVLREVRRHHGLCARYDGRHRRRSRHQIRRAQPESHRRFTADEAVRRPPSSPSSRALKKRDRAYLGTSRWSETFLSILVRNFLSSVAR